MARGWMDSNDGTGSTDVHAARANRVHELPEYMGRGVVYHDSNVVDRCRFLDRVCLAGAWMLLEMERLTFPPIHL